ncbi:MAG: lysophospholipase [Rhodospirillales bacterium]|nr:lysophospholipase [Rhodospirillales bacterium]
MTTRLTTAAAAALLLIAACAPFVNAPGRPVQEPYVDAAGFHAADGVVLPVKSWLPDKNPPKAVVIALHGFNDYSNFFVAPALYLMNAGVAAYAYDQRGFGAGPDAGLWPGTEALVADARAFAKVIRARHPGMPLYLLGSSMGGAVIMVAEASPEPLAADGVILVAPAVWGRATMAWYQRLALWVGVRVMPWVEITGRGLRIKPSDNIEMLMALGADPLVRKATRVDAVWGLANLMDEALASAASLRSPALILYGEKDEIIPRAPTRAMLESLPPAAAVERRVAIYGNGYHMLLRDLGSLAPWKDIAHWIADRRRPLPSGADERLGTWLQAEGPEGRGH